MTRTKTELQEMTIRGFGLMMISGIINFSAELMVGPGALGLYPVFGFVLGLLIMIGGFVLPVDEKQSELDDWEVQG